MRERRIQIGIILILAIVLLANWGVGRRTALAQDPPEVFANGATNEAFELEVIRLVNQERTARGLPPLKRNDALIAGARLHNQDMISNDFFSHTGSDGSSPAERACRQGYSPYPWGSCYVGENIAAGQSSPAKAMNSWMASSGHRANILDPNYREIGVGYAAGGAWQHYWTMDLGAQPNILPVFIDNDANETGTRSVQLTLTSEQVSSWGSIGDISNVQLSEDPDFGDAVWENWAPQKTFTLSAGNGLHTVYVKFSDGSTEVVSSDDIRLNEPAPVLSVEPTRIAYLAVVSATGITPAQYTVQIANIGADTLNWVAGANAPWLQLSRTDGATPDTLQVSVVPQAGMFAQAGVFTAQVVITATNPDALNTPETIQVAFRVASALYRNYLPLVLR